MFQSFTADRLAQPAIDQGLVLAVDSGISTNERVDYLIQNVSLRAGNMPGVAADGSFDPGAELAQHLSPTASKFYTEAPLNFTTNLRHTLNDLGSDVTGTLNNIADAFTGPADAINVAMEFAGLTLGINLFRHALGIARLTDQKSSDLAMAA